MDLSEKKLYVKLCLPDRERLLVKQACRLIIRQISIIIKSSLIERYIWLNQYFKVPSPFYSSVIHVFVSLIIFSFRHFIFRLSFLSHFHFFRRFTPISFFSFYHFWIYIYNCAVIILLSFFSVSRLRFPTLFSSLFFFWQFFCGAFPLAFLLLSESGIFLSFFIFLGTLYLRSCHFSPLVWRLFFSFQFPDET